MDFFSAFIAKHLSDNLTRIDELANDRQNVIKSQKISEFIADPLISKSQALTIILPKAIKQSINFVIIRVDHFVMG